MEAIPPESYNLPQTAAFGGSAVYSKDPFGFVCLMLGTSKKAGTAAEKSALIGTLPEGYRPGSTMYYMVNDAYRGKLSSIAVHPDGRVIGTAYDHDNFGSAYTEIFFYAVH